MPSFSQKSLDKLNTCHPDLQRLFDEVVKDFDCTVLDGHRDKQRQNQMVADGKSKVIYPNGKHNKEPSEAVDVAPFPVDWNDRERFYYFGGFVKGVASRLGIPIRWGGDWDSDNVLDDQTFDDLPHFELKG